MYGTTPWLAWQVGSVAGVATMAMGPLLVSVTGRPATPIRSDLAPNSIGAQQVMLDGRSGLCLSRALNHPIFRFGAAMLTVRGVRRPSFASWLSSASFQTLRRKLSLGTSITTLTLCCYSTLLLLGDS